MKQKFKMYAALRSDGQIALGLGGVRLISDSRKVVREGVKELNAHQISAKLYPCIVTISHQPKK